MLNKERLKKLIYGAELRCVATMSSDIISGVPKSITLRKIKTELLGSNRIMKLSGSELNSLWMEMKNRYKDLYAASYKKLKRSDEDKQDILYEAMRITVLPELQKCKNRIANDAEVRIKGKELSDLTDEGVFYLCSSHINPAKDHAEWEGKIYVSAEWESRCRNASERRRVRRYIKYHDIKTVEWVTGAPVYMCTRPNCKHYFIRVRIDEVIGTPIKTLLLNHKMYMADKKVMSDKQMRIKNSFEDLKALRYLNSLFGSRKLKTDLQIARRVLNRARKAAK